MRLKVVNTITNKCIECHTNHRSARHLAKHAATTSHVQRCPSCNHVKAHGSYEKHLSKCPLRIPCPSCGVSISVRKICSHFTECNHSRLKCPAGCGSSFPSARSFHDLFGKEDGHKCWNDDGSLMIPPESTSRDAPIVLEDMEVDIPDSIPHPAREQCPVEEVEDATDSLLLELFCYLRKEGLKHEALDHTAAKLSEVMSAKNVILEQSLRKHSG